MDKKRKLRQSITIDSDIILKIKEKHINFSSLVNKLLKEYFNNEKNM
jgi:post-segregation antitoxin (ccd killing protein)